VANDVALLGHLVELADVFAIDDPEGQALVDAVIQVLQSAEVKWKDWGLPALAALARTGARPGDRRPAEFLVESAYWARTWQPETFKRPEVQEAFLALVRLDVDIEEAHAGYPKNHPFRALPSGLDPHARYVWLRARVSIRMWPDDDFAFRELLALGDDPALGPTTRARALALGARALADPAEQLRALERAQALDPGSSHLPVRLANALLRVGRVEDGRAASRAAWERWIAEHRARNGSMMIESRLLVDSFRDMLPRGLDAEAEALLADWRAAIDNPRSAQVRWVEQLLRNWRQWGPDAPKLASWIETGLWRPQPHTP
jgi:hypothetical protein